MKAIIFMFAVVLMSCTGPEGPAGPAGPTGPEGPEGPAGAAGGEGVADTIYFTTGTVTLSNYTTGNPNHVSIRLPGVLDALKEPTILNVMTKAIGSIAYIATEWQSLAYYYAPSEYAVNSEAGWYVTIVDGAKSLNGHLYKVEYLKGVKQLAN